MPGSSQDGSIRRFRKRPVVIEARQIPRYGEAAAPGQHEIAEDIAAWCGGLVVGHVGSPAAAIVISTLEGDHLAEPGDFVIRGVAGEFYPCKPDIFEQTYEEAA